MFVLRLIGLGLIFFPLQLLAATAELPEKLSFKLAMQIVDEGNHLEALLAKSEYEAVASELVKLSGLNDYNIDMAALAQYVEPSEVVTNSSNDDHKLSVKMSKTLYDFGYSNVKEQSIETKLSSIRLLLKHIRLSKRIEVARNFFDIKLSDLKFTVDNESIATAYVRFNKTEERNELKQSSDVELLKAQFEYQQVRARRYESETMQRISRAKFSESIARPKQLPSEVIIPDFNFLDRKRPDFEKLVSLALSNNLQLQAQKLLVEAATHELAASRKEAGATLSSEVEWAEYSNETVSKNNWRAALKLSIPLYENDSIKSAKAKARAELQTQRIKQRMIESDIRQQVLEIWQNIYVLKAKRDVDEIAEEYRELYKDRSSAFYEMEHRTDLGDSFVRMSEAKLEKLKNNFELVVTWMKLAMLTGVTLEEYMKQ